MNSSDRGVRTGGEVEWQRHSTGVGACQSPAPTGQNHQLLEAQAGAPQREIVPVVIGLKQTTTQSGDNVPNQSTQRVCVCVLTSIARV